MVKLNRLLTIKRMYEIINELNIPLIDERVYNRLILDEKRYPSVTTFRFDEDESVIRGFLGLAEFFHTVVIKNKDNFTIVHGGKLFKFIT